MEKTVVGLISQGNGYRREAKKDSVLKSAEAEMGGVREENYKSLQLRFFDILQNENSKESIDLGPIHDQNRTNEQELVSLCLGRSPLEHKKDENSRNPTKTREGDEELKASLTLSLDPKSHFSSNPSPEDSLEEVKEAEEPGEAWPPSKIQKRNVDEEAAQQCHAKKARVCVRARCDTPTLFDGCQWRKYGQKIAKGNPCPRSYYRCTVAPACSVRKRVQRCGDDMSILMTTYEGNHNHPLPHSATAMASTTSAAASMLLSGSSASQPGLSSLANATSAIDLNGLNSSLYDSSRTKQFYLPPYASSSMFPTITLDLTASPSTSSSTPSNSFPLTFTSTSKLVHPTSLNLSSNEFNILPAIWGNGNGFQSCSTPPYYQTSIGSFDLGRRQQGHQQYRQQSYIEKNHQAQAAASQQALTETLTKAITSDPGLITVIAAALSSTMEAGTGSSTINGNQGPRESFGQNLKLGEPNNQAMTSNTLTQNEKACASAYFSGLSSSASPRTGSFLQVQPPSPFPIATFKNAFLPDTNKEQNS